MLAAATATCASIAGTREGLAALEVSDYRTAIRELTPVAESGDAAAQSALGRIHLNGWGVPRDPAVAAAWFQRAALGGDAYAIRVDGHRGRRDLGKGFASIRAWHLRGDVRIMLDQTTLGAADESLGALAIVHVPC